MVVSSFWNHQLSASCAKSRRWRNVYVRLLAVSNRSSRRWNPPFSPPKFTNRALRPQANYVTVSGGVYNLGSRDRKSWSSGPKQMGTKTSTNISVSSAEVGRHRLISFPAKWLDLIEKKESEILSNYWPKSFRNTLYKKRGHFHGKKGKAKRNLVLTLIFVWPCIIETIMETTN